ncbi:TIGR03862 family flavoprotein [Hyphomicrobium sp. MC8b]|uniref:TIGR03862 family flavoprotein n=1 Tax=Hyphomicrobium sp. MC8b TaxID=300273 RepID=UPI00391A78E3
MVSKTVDAKDVAIIGAGPAGLFAAEVIANAGHRVSIYERMPSPARKFLLAGRGGLNLTHSEPLERFLTRYGESADEVRMAVETFPPERLIAWANDLDAQTFVGTSGRVFPKAMKASPLLRAWLRRLDSLGVSIKPRHRWVGFNDTGALVFETTNGQLTITPDAALFALGGGSWPKLGSDGAWVDQFRNTGVAITPLEPANCGVRVSWSEVFKSRFEGLALKRIALSIASTTVRGEAVVTANGLEGGAIYALGPQIRAALGDGKSATLIVDLKPDLTQPALAERLGRRRSGETLTNFLRKAAHLDPVAVALLREGNAALPDSADALAARIKALPLQVVGVTDIDRAISTAGGVTWTALDENLMLKDRPGLFVAGEMLDWEAPTGGYLLQGTFATAASAANGLLGWLARRQ